MAENKIPVAATSKEKLSKNGEIDFNKSEWYSSKVKLRSANRNNKSNSSKKSNEQSNKIDKYLCLSNSSITKKGHTNSNTMFKKRKYPSPSAKVDKKIPKVADLLRAKEEFKKLQEIDKQIKRSASQFLNNLNAADIKSPEKQELEELHCKHLSQNKLRNMFRLNLKYLDGIFNGTVYNERHELFKKQLIDGNSILKNDLRVSESLGVYTNDQLIYIVSLFRDRFDEGNKYKYSDYYFKVLLPEYCLKVFMDYHKMSKGDAMEYLKNVPVPDLFGLFC